MVYGHGNMEPAWSGRMYEGGAQGAWTIHDAWKFAKVRSSSGGPIRVELSKHLPVAMLRCWRVDETSIRSLLY